MHEGASGGGKSEMTEHIHRMEDGRLLLGENVVTHEQRTLNLPEACHLRPIADDMACAHPSYQGASKRLVVADAENAWFVRVDHIHSYGTAPNLERLCIDPPEPLLFLNHYVVPGGTCLTWEHVEDAPGKLCPNPRVILPRQMIEDITTGPRPVDVRSFGVRCPPTHSGSRLYGILAMMHVLSPALAWLWRLVAPRGHANPSIQDPGLEPSPGGRLLEESLNGETPMESEGVGSYWAFATGRRVDQANLLLQQIVATPETRYVLLPNQHIGAWKVGYMAEWIAREYLARRGSARFGREQVDEALFSLLGYIPRQLKIEGSMRLPASSFASRSRSKAALMSMKKARASGASSSRASSSRSRCPTSIPLGIASSRPASTARIRKTTAASSPIPCSATMKAEDIRRRARPIQFLVALGCCA
jgi:hypothetical protein